MHRKIDSIEIAVLPNPRASVQTFVSTKSVKCEIAFLIPEKSSSVASRQKKPERMQQFLNFRVEPQGQGSLRPSFSTSSLFPRTTRAPRFTRVSDGNPFRRLLVRSKKGAVLIQIMTCHMKLLVKFRHNDIASHQTSQGLHLSFRAKSRNLSLFENR
jgi:hypothetical protein